MSKKTTRDVIIITLAVIVLLGSSAAGIYFHRDVLFSEDVISRVLDEGGISIHFIDVGQADAVLIMTPEGNMLVDAGTNSSEFELKHYLLDLGIESIDYFVMTHPHDDHVGGADMIIEEFEVDNIIMTDSDEDIEIYMMLMSLVDEHDVNIIKAISGESFMLGELKTTILAPNRDFEEYDEVNSTSVVLKCEFGEKSIILTGDAETDSELEMIEEYGEFLDCDLLKLGHHGSKTSSSYEFLEITSPQYAIACCGTDNTYGHPAAEVMYRLDLFEIELLRTDKRGSIVFVCDGEELEYIK